LSELASVWGWRLALKVWLDGLVLLVELSHVGNQILNDVCVWERIDAGDLVSFGDTAETGEGVASLNVHGAGTADTLTARSAESQSWITMGRISTVASVQFIRKDTNISFLILIRASKTIGPFKPSVIVHKTDQAYTNSLVKVNLVGLHLWLLFGSVWVPSVDLEFLHSLLLLLWNTLGRGNRSQVSNTSSNSTKSTNGSYAHHRRLSEALLGDERKRHLEVFARRTVEVKCWEKERALSTNQGEICYRDVAIGRGFSADEGV
jgi:hypothetical protein